ncbi:ATP-binding cassette domain-containing protein [Bacillus mangrovi]|uniref:ATP-binding cassette domain-containing protein n=1 Tax=Metabacillus mangrovi TaxID=1491830 RepID=A0A7X2S215_9BACI|nr:ABC transporter ATP-binding protein [Metabacillus mangrovi]MTH51865.1 ATP-binding cassette domain-containing protein [Metabacillus mangrovi]
MFVIKTLSYKEILYIKEMEFEEGKVTSLIGESGAGKSTLLKMLNGLLSPDKGSITYKGKELSELNFIQHRREAVMLAQQPVIFEGSVRDNLLIGRKFSEKPPVDDQMLTEALSFIKLDKDLDDDAEDLSGGEKQRLALARVYIMDPDCYLLDEPTSALDEGTEEEIVRRFLEKVKGKTVIMVTHSNEIAEKYSDQVITLHKLAKDHAHE